jgi:hypothetical protein
MRVAELYAIWEVEELVEFPWRVQLHNYIGQFLTRGHAERYIAGIKKARERAESTSYMEAKELTTRKKVK